MHVGFANLDVIEAHNGIDDDGMGFGAFADDLAMDLGFRGNVDNEIAANARLAAKAPAGRHRGAPLDVALLDVVP